MATKKTKKTDEETPAESAQESAEETPKKKSKSPIKDASEEKKDSPEDKKAKLAKLLAKAKQLEGSVEEAKSLDIKKKLKEGESEKADTLVPMEDYLKASIHLGTRVITPDMRKYVYRRRADGLAVFNTAFSTIKFVKVQLTLQHLLRKTSSLSASVRRAGKLQRNSPS